MIQTPQKLFPRLRPAAAAWLASAVLIGLPSPFAQANNTLTPPETAGKSARPASAATQSPIGTWLTIDDDGKTAKSKVKIVQRNGKLYGHIVHIVDPSKRDAKCTKCTDDRKHQPIVGLEIIRGLSKSGDRWEDGRILDPNNGKEYDCYIEVVDGGARLKVRGFVGVSMFGRTQYWKRS